MFSTRQKDKQQSETESSPEKEKESESESDLEKSPQTVIRKLVSKTFSTGNKTPTTPRKRSGSDTNTPRRSIRGQKGEPELKLQDCLQLINNEYKRKSSTEMSQNVFGVNTKQDKVIIQASVIADQLNRLQITDDLFENCAETSSPSKLFLPSSPTKQLETQGTFIKTAKEVVISIQKVFKDALTSQEK